MSREDVVQANYWQGALTRAEAQKVFDEFAQGITNMAQEQIQMKAVISCIMQKFNITPEEVSAWVTAQVSKMKAEDLTKAQEMQTALETPKQVTLE